MESALADMLHLVDAGVQLEEADWSKARGIDFRQALTRRNELATQLEFFAVEAEEGFAGSVSLCGFCTRRISG